MLTKAFAEVYPYGEKDTVLGSVQRYTVKRHESLIEIAGSLTSAITKLLMQIPALTLLYRATVHLLRYQHHGYYRMSHHMKESLSISPK